MAIIILIGSKVKYIRARPAYIYLRTARAHDGKRARFCRGES